MILGLIVIVLLLVGYGVWVLRDLRAAVAELQDKVSRIPDSVRSDPLAGNSIPVTFDPGEGP